MAGMTEVSAPLASSADLRRFVFGFRLDCAVGAQQQRDEHDNCDSEQHRHGHLPCRRHRTLPNAQ
jgi:hypothetical protein